MSEEKYIFVSSCGTMKEKFDAESSENGRKLTEQEASNLSNFRFSTLSLFFLFSPPN